MDHYVKTGDNNIHMANILWSCAIILAVVLLLGLVLERSLARDFASLEILRGNRRAKRDERRNGGDLGSEEDVGLTSNRAKSVKANDVAWKKLQGDVFRRPEFSTLLCVFVGIGIQILSILVITLFFCTMGLIRPESRWYHLYTCFSYTIVGGMVNGYVTTRAMKYFGASEWRFAASTACLVLPAYIGMYFTMVDLIEYWEKSDQVIPLTSSILYLLIWGMCNVPAVYFSAYNGFVLSNDKPPCKIAVVKRTIPE